MEIRNASEMAEKGHRSGNGWQSVQLHPVGPAGHSFMAVDLLEIEPGATMPPTAHSEEQLLFVVAGTGELTGSAPGGPTVVVRPDSVAYIAAREGYALRNTGNQPLRVLVSLPLIAASDRALGLTQPLNVDKVEEQPTLIAAQPKVEDSVPQAAPAAEGRIRETAPEPTPAPDAPPEATAAPVVESEPVPPDISALVKRASDVAAAPRTERKKPQPLLEPVPETDEPPSPEEEVEEAQSSLMELQVIFDGGSRGNPGQGYGSFMVQSPNRKPVIKRVEFGDNYTNNQAEYDTLIESLVYIIERLEATNRSPQQVALDIKTDSDLVVNQLLGSFKVKDAGLKIRNAKALELLGRFGDWLINWHPREESVKLLGH